MKKNNFISFILVSLIFILAGCSKELDLQPTDTFNENNSYQNLDDIDKGLQGAYDRYGAYANDMYVSALLSDEGKLGPDNGGGGVQAYRYQFSSDATSGGDVVAAWGSYYYLIDQVNRVLAKLPNVTATITNPEAKRDIFKGQLLGLRALGHFGLLQAYCKKYDPTDVLGVPVMLESNPLAQPARNTVGQVMNQIQSDITEAKALLANELFSDVTLNKANIPAFQARIALYMGDYDAAINYASAVISSNVKVLAGQSNFPDIWTDDPASYEVLFRVKYTTSGISSLWTATSGDIYISPSTKLYDSYGSGDIRLSSYFAFNGDGDIYINKFYSGQNTRVVDIKPIRIAEMYLIRAESYAKKASPDLTLGGADLNRLRSYRIAPYTNQTFATADVLFQGVMDERFKELAFEGFRFFDLKRNNLPVERLLSDASTEWQTLPSTSYRFVLPIPRDELNANPNMVQNAGY